MNGPLIQLPKESPFFCNSALSGSVVSSRAGEGCVYFIVVQTVLFSPLYWFQNYLCRFRSPMLFLCLDKKSRSR
jgi:hypothetical protein